MYCTNKVVLGWRTLYPVKLNVCFGVTDCSYDVHPYRFEMETHSLLFYCDTVLHCHRWSQLVCSLPQYPHQNFSALLLPLLKFSSLNTPAWWQITVCLFGQLKWCATQTLCFSAHVGNNLAVVIITHLPRSWESSASIVARLWPQNSEVWSLARTKVFSLLWWTVHRSSGAQPNWHPSE
jgi:hypothetical protein